MISERELELARAIRAYVGPLRGPDGALNASRVAQEATHREMNGLPAWIAELDAPRNGLDRIEDQKIPQDHESDPGDTMPAQGWLDQATDAWLEQNTDAGRLPAPRKEHTMAGPATDQGGIRTLDAEVRDELRPFPETDDRYGYDQATIDRWADATGTEQFELAASQLSLAAISRLTRLCDEVADEHQRRAARAARVRDELRELATSAVGILSAHVEVQAEARGGIR